MVRRTVLVKWQGLNGEILRWNDQPAAQQPSEYLKTIVPISGSIGVQEMFRELEAVSQEPCFMMLSMRVLQLMQPQMTCE